MLCCLHVSSAVCGDRPSVHRRSTNTRGLGGRRRRAQWLCVHCKVRTDFSHTHTLNRMMYMRLWLNIKCVFVVEGCCSPWLRSTSQLLTDRSSTACSVSTSQLRRLPLPVTLQHSHNRRARRGKVMNVSLSFLASQVCWGMFYTIWFIYSNILNDTCITKWFWSLFWA